jgi:ribose transport system substrate-binding protein
MLSPFKLVQQMGCLLALTWAASSLHAADKDGQVVIAFLGQTSTDPAYAVALAGAQRAAADLGESYLVKVTVQDLTPPSGSGVLQAAAIDAAVKAGVNGITLACADPKLVAPAIDRAAAAGVFVATFNSDAPDSQRFFAYLSDNDQCAQTLLVQLANSMGGKGVIGILASDTDSELQRLRIEGAKSAARLYPAISIKGVYTTPETGDDSVRRLAELTKANPDITGWIMLGSWPLAAPKAFPWAAGSVKCVAVGLLGNQTQYLKDGHVQMAITQPFYQWGYRTTERLIMRIVLNRKPPEPIEYAPLALVTSKDLADFEKEADSWSAK